MTTTAPLFADPRELLARLLLGSAAIEAALDRGDSHGALDQIRRRELLVRSLTQQLAGAPSTSIDPLRDLYAELAERDRRIEVRLERLRAETMNALRAVHRERRSLTSFQAPDAGPALLSDHG
ncbi:MAG: hypothetical protein U0610_21915 [bacterium]